MSKARQLADLGNQVDDGAITGTNMVVNGGMTVAQRGTSVTGLTDGSTGYHTVDRFRFIEGGSPTYVVTATQSTDAPDGFAYSHKFEVTTAQSSLGSTDQMGMDTSIEGQDLQHLKWGTSSAQKLTLSFWVKSSNTGTYVVWFYKWDDARAVTTTYTIDAADTWEYKTITAVGDTTGALDNNNDKSLLVRWVMAGGTGTTSGTASDTWRADVTTNRNVGLDVNLADTVGNTFLLTGVCLNVGDSAIDFPHESYGDTLAKCKRYYERVDSGSSPYLPLGMAWAPNEVRWVQGYTEKRTGPTISTTGSIRVYKAGGGNVLFTSPTTDQISSKSVLLYKTVSGLSATQGDVLQFICGSGVYIELDAEL